MFKLIDSRFKMFVKQRCYFVIHETKSQKCVTLSNPKCDRATVFLSFDGDDPKRSQMMLFAPLRNAALSELMIQGTKTVLMTSLLQRNVPVYC